MRPGFCRSVLAVPSPGRRRPRKSGAVKPSDLEWQWGRLAPWQERTDRSVGGNLRQLMAGAHELFLVNNSLRCRKSAYEDEMPFITHRRSAWLGITFQSLQLIKRC